MLEVLKVRSNIDWIDAYNQTSYAQQLWSEFYAALKNKRNDMARRIRTQYKCDLINFSQGI